MKATLLFIKANLFSIKPLVIVYFSLITAFGGYGQSGKPRVDIDRVYGSEIERLLLPTNKQASTTPLLAAFLAHPVLDPDFSVCLKDSAGQFFLESRLPDKNINQELMSRFMQKLSLTLPIKVSVYSVMVSKRLKKKMLKAFDRINPVRENPHIVVQYDGECFEFKWVNNGDMKSISISYELKTESYVSEFIKLLTQISIDLKNNSFKESNYMDKFK